MNGLPFCIQFSYFCSTGKEMKAFIVEQTLHPLFNQIT